MYLAVSTELYINTVKRHREGAGMLSARWRIQLLYVIARQVALIGVVPSYRLHIPFPNCIIVLKTYTTTPPVPGMLQTSVLINHYGIYSTSIKSNTYITSIFTSSSTGIIINIRHEQ